MRKYVVVLICLFVGQVMAGEDYRYTGPYTKDNLSIMIIHGKTKYNNKLITLSEAMKQGKVKVYETGAVNKLAIENVSETDVYIQAGDIVKGGKQDRVFSDDMVLPRRSGRQDISSFCVEAGRWRKRGGEDSKKFSQSSYRLSSKELKLAAKSQKNQSEVWDKVKKMQDKMGRALGKSVRKQESASSLQLSLEDKDAKTKVKDYVNALVHVADKEDAVGLAFSINGKLNSVDIYANRELFQKMWPRLLHAAATEALVEKTEKKSHEPLRAAEIRDLLRDANGKQTKNKVNKRTQITATDDKKRYKALTFDEKHKAVVHTNLIRK